MIERRMFPRFPVRLRAEISQDGDASFEAVAIELSRSGLSLETTRETVEVLAQGGSVLTPGDRFRVQLEFGEATGCSGSLKVDCLTSHARRISQARYHIGARFDGIETGEARLEAYLNWCAQQRGC
jgi:hypothetical protein